MPCVSGLSAPLPSLGMSGSAGTAAHTLFLLLLAPDWVCMYIRVAVCSLGAAASCFGACDALGMSVHYRLLGAVGLQAEPRGCTQRVAQLTLLSQEPALHWKRVEENQEVTSLCLQHCKEWISSHTSLPTSSSCPQYPFAPGAVTRDRNQPTDPAGFGSVLCPAAHTEKLVLLGTQWEHCCIINMFVSMRSNCSIFWVGEEVEFAALSASLC